MLNPLKKVLKNVPKKVIFKTSLTNMSKSEKNAYCRQVFANNFFGAFFKNFFNGFEISVKFCVFDTHLVFLSLKDLFALIRTFSKLCMQMRTKGMKTLFL
jgi:hypothetical protein